MKYLLPLKAEGDRVISYKSVRNLKFLLRQDYYISTSHNFVEVSVFKLYVLL